MRKITLSFLMIAIAFMATAQQKQFDIVSYNLPKGFTEDKTADRLTVTKDGGTKGFCIITVFKSIDASNDSKKNFDLSWEELIRKIISVNQPQMQPTVTEDGWVTEVGSSAFEKDGIAGTAILLSSTQNEKLVNVQVLLNGEAYINDMTAFLETLKMKAVSAENSEKTKPTTADNNNQKITTPKHEVWMNYKYSMTKRGYTVRYLLKYANGVCLDDIPEQGVLGLSKTANNSTERNWGVAKDKGTETHIEYNDGSILKIGKESATKASYPVGSNTSFYFKCIPVDGLKLDGEWSSGGGFGNPNWYKLPNFDGGTIRFYKDGRFENNKGHTSMKEGDNGFITKDEGKGTYYIKDFTIVMKYDDGSEFRSSFSGYRSVSPFQDNAILFFRGVPYYKKLN